MHYLTVDTDDVFLLSTEQFDNLNGRGCVTSQKSREMRILSRQTRGQKNDTDISEHMVTHNIYHMCYNLIYTHIHTYIHTYITCMLYMY